MIPQQENSSGNTLRLMNEPSYIYKFISLRVVMYMSTYVCTHIVIQIYLLPSLLYRAVYHRGLLSVGPAVQWRLWDAF